ncbi:hypothetical protein HS041_26655 [Planomonospora sp. ID67723]|uniref:hypothetical protein n=1 Tax=Planomonospora sp. ID67723 TaxID=2738134 RepID=UPI0018C3F813|nr:hypothetical protein [Planomonospora sp. ID67723]MBG0831331.1 hypothetical protein [Planomonospora sp. ID67723]
MAKKTGPRMTFRHHTPSRAINGYRQMEEYFCDVRSFFEVLNVRFSIPEYGVGLQPIGGQALFSNANSYLLSDDSSYPFYLWLPTWLGRFYLDPTTVPPGTAVDDCPMGQARLLAFVWPWLGFNDAYLDDAEPECWFGVCEPSPADLHEKAVVTAEKIFLYFRLERTRERETNGWTTGGFRGAEIGCDLQGRWFLRRVPLSELTTYHGIEKNVIAPLGELFHRLQHPGGGVPQLTTVQLPQTRPRQAAAIRSDGQIDGGGR